MSPRLRRKSSRCRKPWGMNGGARGCDDARPKKEKGARAPFSSTNPALWRLQHVADVNRFGGLHHEAVRHLLEYAEDDHEPGAFVRQPERSAFELCAGLCGVAGRLPLRRIRNDGNRLGLAALEPGERRHPARLVV